MSKHFRGCQNKDGGWGYVKSSASTPNMATAGLASMFLVFDSHHGKSFYTAKVTLAGVELVHMIRKGQVRPLPCGSDADQFRALAA